MWRKSGFFARILHDTPISLRESLAFMEKQRACSIYTVGSIAFIGGIYGIFNAVTQRDPLVLALRIAFLALLGAGSLVYFVTRKFNVAKYPIYAGLLLLIFTTFHDAGGITGLGLFFILPALPILYIAVGSRASSAFAVFAGLGMVARILYGHYPVTSVLNQPGAPLRMIVVVLFSTAVVILVFHRIDVLMAQLTQLVMTDWETGLSGRWKFREVLRNRFVRKTGTGLQESFSLVGFRIINYERVNAMEGPSRSDAVLQAVGSRLKGWREHVEITCRWHSSLFLTLLDTGDFLEVDSTCRDLLAVLSKPVDIDGRPVSLLCSVAVTRFPDDFEDPDGVDEAEKMVGHVLSTLDRHGNMPDELIFFNKKMHQAERYRYGLLESLVKADFDSGLSLQYQPKVRFADGTCAGAEVLMRWNHPILGSVSPVDFIPLAEESGSIRRLTRKMIRQVFLDLRSPEFLEALGSTPPIIAINLSVNDLTNQDLLPFLNRELKVSPIEPSWIEFEITEGVLLGDNPWIRINLENLLILGFRLAIDDFGTGYSSLSYLQRLMVHDLKIDQSFVRELSEGNAKANSSVIDAIVSMGKSLGLEITAEGVETEYQAAYLAERGCDLAQGWLYSKSLPFGDFVAYYKAHQAVLSGQ